MSDLSFTASILRRAGQAAGASLLLATMLFSPGCGPKTEQPEAPATGQGETTPTTTTSVSAANPAGEKTGNNMIADAQFANLLQNWKITFTADSTVKEFAVESATLPEGKSMPAIRLATNQSGELNLAKPVSVDPNKAYRFTIWLKQDPTTQGQRFFGAYAYGPDKKMLGLVRPDGSVTPANQHFIEINFRDGQWHQVTGYLLPANTPNGWKAPKDATGMTFKMQPTTAQAGLFFLNYYNKGKTVSTWAAAPSIEETTLAP